MSAAPERVSGLTASLFALRWVAVWKRHARVWRKLAGPALLGNIGEPLLYLLALGYGLGSFIGELQGMGYVAFLASGLVCASAMNTATFEGLYSAYTRMAVQETWNAMLYTPLDLEDIIIGEAVWAASKSLLSASAILLVATLLGAVQGPQALGVLPVAFLTGLCFSGLALVVTVVARNYDFFLYYFTLFLTPVLLLSGVFFPLDHMPTAIQFGAELFPLSHAIALVRPWMTGQPLADGTWVHIAVLLAYTVAALSLATHLCRRRILR
ncbi:MAG: ABC transporter permease [Gammaproteobacteria bacterium]|nr:ABC transporter permease [Gammaproteobacteria bacterium]